MKNLNRYLTFSDLYNVLNSNAISVACIGISFLFITQMNLAGLMFLLLTIIAVPFSIYMLLVLYRHEKKSWIVSFLMGLGISFLPMIVFSENSLFLFTVKFMPLLFLILYNMLIKAKIREWRTEKNMLMKRLIHDRG